MNYILLLVLLEGAFAVRVPRQANGCGSSGGLTINGLLEAVGEGVIISCCNQHDICYDKCGMTQARCDSYFKTCLNRACHSINGNRFQWWTSFRRAACELDGKILYTIVDISGTKAFNAAQEAHGCRSG